MILDSVKLINDKIKNLDNLEDKVEGIYLNGIGNELVKFNAEYFVPVISVFGVENTDVYSLVDNWITFIPEFLKDHSYSEKRLPASDINNAHFVKKISGKALNFIHLLKFDMKFGGNSSAVVKKGDNEHYPSYNTDRAYYKSQLVPVIDDSNNYKPLKLKDADTVESDMSFHTFAFFDEVNEKELSKKIYNLLEPEIYNISTKIYSFLKYNLLTSCFNVIYPNEKEINLAMEIFEPLFIFIYSNYREIGKIIDVGQAKIDFEDSLIFDNDKIVLNSKFKEKLKNYFERFSLTRNDELMLKGWRKFEYEL